MHYSKLFACRNILKSLVLNLKNCLVDYFNFRYFRECIVKGLFCGNEVLLLRKDYGHMTKAFVIYKSKVVDHVKCP